MMYNTTELNLNVMERVAGGSYLKEIEELHNAVFANGVTRYYYDQFLKEDDDRDEEELLALVLDECYGLHLTFENGKMLYNGRADRHKYTCDWIRRRNH